MSKSMEHRIAVQSGNRPSGPEQASVGERHKIWAAYVLNNYIGNLKIKHAEWLRIRDRIAGDLAEFVQRERLEQENT